jgi:glucose-6-phosphate isomerase
VLDESLRKIDDALSGGGGYESPFHVFRLPSDRALASDVHDVAQRLLTARLRYVVLIGIGGSNLGAIAIADAIQGCPGIGHDGVRLVSLDTCAPAGLSVTIEKLTRDIQHAEEVAIIIVSKSGTTTETVFNASVILEAFAGEGIDVHRRVAVITDPGSVLWEYAESEGYLMLPVPKSVGGRFSVFSAVGLLPLMLLGIDTAMLREGAREIIRAIIARAPNDPTQLLIGSMYRAYQQNFRTLNFFFFDPSLESVGKWCRQLYAESLGKEHDRSGKQIHAGFTPIVSIGSTDLHSMAQLYFAGPRDKMTIFVRVKDTSMRGPTARGSITALVPGLEGKSAWEVMDAIYRGVDGAYDARRLPSVSIELSDRSAFTIGAFLALQEVAVVLLADLLHVNAFDQPNVEEYKRGTRAALGMHL